MNIGNFLDFRPEELIRTISVVINLRLMTPLSGSIADSSTWTQIGTLSSDIEIAIMFRYFSTQYQFLLGYRNNANNIALFSTSSFISFRALDMDFYLIVVVSRSVADPTEIIFSKNVRLFSTPNYYYNPNHYSEKSKFHSLTIKSHPHLLR